MTKEWNASIFGCFGNPKLCILSFCVPCYAMGKNAEAVGENCMLIGLLTCLGLNFGPVTRWRLRQEKGIEGSMLLDVLLYAIIPCCALVQEAQEIGWGLPEELSNVGKKKGDTGASEPQAGEDMARA